MKLPKIVGIAGMNGAGKDTLGELLVERCGYNFVSLSDILRAELTRQGVPHAREHMRALSSKWHRENGPGHLSRIVIETFEQEEEALGYRGVAIGSIRRPDEARAVQRAGGVIVWIDADRKLRYKRIQSSNRGRREDTVSFERWLADEEVEMKPSKSDDGSGINMTGVRDIADIHIDNSYSSIESYRQHLIEKFEL